MYTYEHTLISREAVVLGTLQSWAWPTPKPVFFPCTEDSSCLRTWSWKILEANWHAAFLEPGVLSASCPHSLGGKPWAAFEGDPKGRGAGKAATGLSLPFSHGDI